jgi:hypothetical protein
MRPLFPGAQGPGRLCARVAFFGWDFKINSNVTNGSMLVALDPDQKQQLPAFPLLLITYCVKYFLVNLRPMIGNYNKHLALLKHARFST